MSLIARHLEANGLPTLCLGSAFDILAAGRPPRAVFVDYPLGHSAGQAFNPADQENLLRGALAAFASIDRPGTLVTLPNRWPDPDWTARAEEAEEGDTRQPRDDSPQWQFPADAEAARASGALRP